MAEAADVKKIYGETLLRLKKSGLPVVAGDADLMRLTGTSVFKAAFPEAYFQVGIAEQNLIGVAAGYAHGGSVVFVSSFCNFLALRAADQIANTVCHNRLDVKICGTYAGMTSERNGETHISAMDLAIFRAMPHLNVIDPADGPELEQALECAAKTRGPFYIRMAKGPLKPVLPPGARFELGKAVPLRAGAGPLLVTSGVMTAEGAAACALLEQRGVDAKHLHMPTLKPFDAEALLAGVERDTLVVAVDNHSVIGGLGAAVAEALSGAGKGRLVRLGIPDCFAAGAEMGILFPKYGVSAQSIADTVCENLNL